LYISRYFGVKVKMGQFVYIYIYIHRVDYVNLSTDNSERKHFTPKNTREESIIFRGGEVRYLKFDLESIFQS